MYAAVRYLLIQGLLYTIERENERQGVRFYTPRVRKRTQDRLLRKSLLSHYANVPFADRTFFGIGNLFS